MRKISSELYLMAWRICALVVMVVVGPGNPAVAQGPMPEEGATLFPYGALVSYGSTFRIGTHMEETDTDASESGTHPTFASTMPLTFSWSFRRDLQFSAQLPIVTKRIELPQEDQSEAGMGDALITLKYRFLRFDSERGTTQMSFAVGPTSQGRIPASRGDPAGHGND